jgi:hypothetical protein
MSTSPSDEAPETRLIEVLQSTIAVGQDLEDDTLLIQQDGSVFSLLQDWDGDFVLVPLRFHPC